MRTDGVIQNKINEGLRFHLQTLVMISLTSYIERKKTAAKETRHKRFYSVYMYILLYSKLGQIDLCYSKSSQWLHL